MVVSIFPRREGGSENGTNLPVVICRPVNTTFPTHLPGGTKFDAACTKLLWSLVNFVHQVILLIFVIYYVYFSNKCVYSLYDVLYYNNFCSYLLILVYCFRARLLSLSRLNVKVKRHQNKTNSRLHREKYSN